MVRAKGNVRTGGASAVAFGVDVRLPTGDEMNLLGSGAAGIQPFVIWSASFPHFSPHVNASYKRNGSSVLAGNPATGRSAHFPDQAGYGVGVEVGVNSRVTVAFDVFGRYTIDGERLRPVQFQALDRAIGVSEYRVRARFVQRVERCDGNEGQSVRSTPARCESVVQARRARAAR